MEVLILGRGCLACDTTARNAERAIQELSLDAVSVRAWKMADMAQYGFPRPPGLVMDARRICSGRAMGIREINHWLLRGRDAACAA